MLVQEAPGLLLLLTLEIAADAEAEEEVEHQDRASASGGQRESFDAKPARIDQQEDEAGDHHGAADAIPDDEQPHGLRRGLRLRISHALHVIPPRFTPAAAGSSAHTTPKRRNE